MQKYVIGVDGGNTKTDFLLFTTQGDFVDVLRTGTCSHEAEGNMGFDEAYRRLRQHILALLERNCAGLSQVASAAFGLAGVDLPHQHRALYARLEGLGIPRFAVANDAILGIKAASVTGSGICSVNGTGTVTCGIDPLGNTMQVGGIGGVCGDSAGGHHIALRAVAAVHDMFYRGDPRTPLADSLFELLGVTTKEAYLEGVAGGVRELTTEINIRLEECANNGDPAAMRILDSTGEFLGRSAVGCINLLSFGESVEIVLVGSVWVKCAYPGMLGAFRRTIEERVDKNLDIKTIASPPATGAVAWALALGGQEGGYTALRQRVMAQINHETYERLVK